MQNLLIRSWAGEWMYCSHHILMWDVGRSWSRFLGS